eukprot:9501978-Pyramimonas_sp.AAC.1
MPSGALASSAPLRPQTSDFRLQASYPQTSDPQTHADLMWRTRPWSRRRRGRGGGARTAKSETRPQVPGPRPATVSTKPSSTKQPPDSRQARQQKKWVQYLRAQGGRSRRRMRGRMRMRGSGGGG